MTNPQELSLEDQIIAEKLAFQWFMRQSLASKIKAKEECEDLAKLYPDLDEPMDSNHSGLRGPTNPKWNEKVLAWKKKAEEVRKLLK